MYLDVAVGFGWVTLIVFIYSFAKAQNRKQAQSISMILLSVSSLSLVPYMLNESQRVLQSIGLLILFGLLIYVSLGSLKDRFEILYTSKLLTVTMSVFLMVYTVSFVQNFLITMTARDTVFLLSLTGFEAEITQVTSGTFINFPSAEQPLKTKIITACTGIGTISVFIGLITSFEELSTKQKIALSFVVACLIYSLNAIRNFFIAASYGYQMLHIAPGVIETLFGRGDEWVSYYIADRIISQLGSLVFISYLGYRLMNRYDSNLIGEWVDILRTLKKDLEEATSSVRSAFQAYRQ